MSEQRPESNTEQNGSEQSSEQPPEGGEPKTFDADYVANLRKENARYRTEAKTATAELEKQRKASMTEAEKAVAEAETRGRTEAVRQYGQRLAKSEITAAAATAQADLGGVFDYLDLSRFVTDDGDIDDNAIKAFVAGLPKKGAVPPSFDGGTRTTSPAKDMNSFIRQAAGLQ